MSDLSARLAATRRRPFTADEAKKSAQRLIDAAFHNHDRPKPEFSIPVNGDNDDVFLMDYLDQVQAALTRAKGAVREACAAEADRWADAGGHVGTVGEAIRSLPDPSVSAYEERIRTTELARCTSKLRKVAAQCGAGGHTQREKMFNAIATELEAESEQQPQETKLKRESTLPCEAQTEPSQDEASDSEGLGSTGNWQAEIAEHLDLARANLTAEHESNLCHAKMEGFRLGQKLMRAQLTERDEKIEQLNAKVKMLQVVETSLREAKDEQWETIRALVTALEREHVLGHIGKFSECTVRGCIAACAAIASVMGKVPGA